MRVVIFTHSLVSDWNHGNAHFLRGIALELSARGFDLRIFEPADGWSRRHLIAEHGESPVADFQRRFPQLTSTLYHPATIDLNAALEAADLVLVHEWNDPALVKRIGEHRLRHGSYTLLFHDTHHRSVTAPEEMNAYDLRHYDGALAFGQTIRNLYLTKRWTQHAWTWHECADVRTFRPHPRTQLRGDLIWVGNWGDNERVEELREYLIGPVQRLGLQATVYGVRYPTAALNELRTAGIAYHGWLPNYQVSELFAQFQVTIHVPRRPYAARLPGIPTIRPFEALASGIPLISAPWQDTENLFRAGTDLLFVRDGREMQQALQAVLHEPALRASLIRNGLDTIHSRHTCRHRVEELLRIHQECRANTTEAALIGRT